MVVVKIIFQMGETGKKKNPELMIYFFIRGS